MSFGLLEMIPKRQYYFYMMSPCKENVFSLKVTFLKNMFIDMRLVNNKIAMKSYIRSAVVNKLQNIQIPHTWKLTVSQTLFYHPKNCWLEAFFIVGNDCFFCKSKNGKTCLDSLVIQSKSDHFQKVQTRKKVQQKFFTPCITFQLLPSILMCSPFEFQKKSRPKFSHLSFHSWCCIYKRVLLFLRNNINS